MNAVARWVHCHQHPFTWAFKSLWNALMLRGEANDDLRLWLKGAVDLVKFGRNLTPSFLI